MLGRWIVPVIVLPGTVLVFVPLAILRLTRGGGMFSTAASFDSMPFWIAVAVAIPGVALALSSMALFFRFGEDYTEYCRHVGRWIPRLRPWSPPSSATK